MIHPEKSKAELASSLREEGKTQGCDVFMVLGNPTSGSVFVKELDFFKSQGGMTQRWGDNWIPILATDVEDARKRGCSLFPYARPYDQQAK